MGPSLRRVAGWVHHWGGVAGWVHHWGGVGEWFHHCGGVGGWVQPVPTTQVHGMLSHYFKEDFFVPPMVSLV